MENDLSIWQLVLYASVTVQLVMLTLVLASLASWYMIVQRVLYFRDARQAADRFEERFWSGIDLSQLYRDDSDKEGGAPPAGLEAVFRAGFREFSRLRQQLGADSAAVMEGAQRAMRVAMSREGEQMDRHLPFLATVGSTSPYVGLFGTVWGIMTAFTGLANVHQATLATVAPGIAEALVATAMGLFAAIPAVVAYNRFTAWSDSLGQRYDTFAEEFSGILHRQAHAGSGRRAGD